jgi:MFS family permease
MGFCIGGEYSLDSGYTSELMPQRWRSTMVGIVKASCALGNILAAGLCYGVLSGGLAPQHWPPWRLRCSCRASASCKVRNGCLSMAAMPKPRMP